MKRTARLTLAVPAVVVLAGLGAKSMALAHGGEVSFEAYLALVDGNSHPSDQELDLMYGKLVAAADFAPEDPALQELVGSLDLRRGGSLRIAEAGEHLALALARRPVSPYAWASLAAQKYRSGDTGEVFEQALRNAAQLGPNEPAVQGTVANFGLAVYGEVSAPTRVAIDTMISNGIKRSPVEFMQIAERRGRLNVACSHFSGSSRQADAKWIQTCKALEATP